VRQLAGLSFSGRPAVSDRGASSVEYGLLLGAITAVLVLVLYSLGQITTDSYDTTCDMIKNKGTAAGVADGSC